MRKRVVVAGGGFAGMAAATILAEQGFQVTLVEPTAALGGKAKSARTPDGHPTEHSHRIFTFYHEHLMWLLARVPAAHGGSLLDHFVAVTESAVFDDGFATRSPRKPRRLGKPWSAPRRWIARLLRPLTLPFWMGIGMARFAIGFSMRGVPLLETLDYLRLHLRAVAMCEARQLDELGSVSYGDYLRLPERSAAFQRYFARLPQIVTAAKPEAEARSIVLMMLRLVFRLQTPPPGREHFASLMALDGPTSERLVAPWGAYLERLGVEVVTGQGVEDFAFEGDRVAAVRLADGRSIEAGDVILAVPYPALGRLLERTALGGRAPGLAPQGTLKLEFSNGMQLYLAAAPGGDTPQGSPGVPTMHLDSPWSFISVLQGEGLWQDVQLPAGTRHVLSATWSNGSVPGVVTGKPAVSCTRDELLQECLRQCNLPPDLQLKGWALDYELESFPTDAYAARRDALPPHLAGPAHDGQVTVTYAPLVIKLPGHEAHALRTRTEVPNLYLAGEHVETRFAWPSMEKAVESGVNAAREVLRERKPEALPAVELAIVPVPFGFLRRLDGWLYARLR